MAFYNFSFFFSKNFKKNNNFSNLNFSTLWWSAIRVRSRAGSLASIYDCSIFFGFREMAFFNDLFFFFFKKLRYKKLTELEFLNPIVGCYQGKFEGC